MGAFSGDGGGVGGFSGGGDAGSSGGGLAGGRGGVGIRGSGVSTGEVAIGMATSSAGGGGGGGGDRCRLVTSTVIVFEHVVSLRFG